MDEEAFLDEHYRSLPPIIQFSNNRWYSNRLRVMRDHDDRRFGDPGSPIVTLHKVLDGRVTPGTQENAAEARELIDALLADEPRMTALRREARETVAREFTWERCGRDTVSAYRSVLDG